MELHSHVSLFWHLHPLDGGDPEVIIYTLPDSKGASQEESVVCEVRGPSLGDVYIMWQVDGGNYMEGNSGHLKRDNGNESVVSILTVPSESVREATLFNCAVKYGGMKDHTTPYLKKYSKSKYQECHICNDYSSLSCTQGYFIIIQYFDIQRD